MKNIYFRSILLLSAFSFSVIIQCVAQENERTQQVKLTSNILNEERELLIHLPEKYSVEKPYPVIYMTDGETSNFEVARSYIDVLSNPEYDIIPQSILVGITQKDRNAELRAFQSRSNAHQFIQFIIDEIIPYIDRNFKTSGFNTMIGHSDGAEFNHFLMLAEGNPFRGFITISTDFNKDVKDDIAEFFTNYKDNNLYYFIANGERDILPRIEAGNAFENIYSNINNERIILEKKTYPADHRSLVALSLLDGINFIFKDYKNMAKYPTVASYGENYLADLKQIYGIEGSYNIGDTEVYWEDIFENNKIEDYHYMSKFYSEQFGFPIDPLNHANNYFALEEYDLSIEYFNKALEDKEALNPGFYYQNIFRALEAYKLENRLKEAITFLEKCRDTFPEQYSLFISYKLAIFSHENEVSTRKGKAALEYCKINYRENKLFTMADLESLSF